MLVSPLPLRGSLFSGWDGTCILPAKSMLSCVPVRKERARRWPAAFINTILDARSFNWTLMFMDLERILPGGVRVISIEPRQVAGHVEVKLTVGANSDEAELKFEHALEESNEFAEVHIQSVTSASAAGNQGGDQKVIQLTTVYSRT